MPDIPTVRDFSLRRHDLQLRYAYFLMAVAGAGVALALRATEGQALAGHHAFLGFAVLAWASSFVAGVLAVLAERREVEEGANYFLDGDTSVLSDPPPREQANDFTISQLVLVGAGAALYVIWHVIQMVALAASP